MSDSGIADVPKIAPPRLNGVIARKRLFDKLANECPNVVWIAAAPGAGKTTLAASYAEASGANVLWYQVDAGDADPATFFYFMRQAALRSGARKASTLPLLQPESAVVDIAAFARQFFIALFSILPARSMLIIDNVQETDAPTFETILRLALEQVPERITVILLSLTRPPPTLARLVANGLLDLIGADELRFTRRESDDVVLSKLAVDRTTLTELHERSEGWAAGLVLMIERMRYAGGPAPSLDASQEGVFDYFLGEIFAGLAPDEQRTLMLTASLPRVTARLAQAMSGMDGADRLLERLHRRHLFVDRRHGSEHSYQYHGLFKAFLLDRARDGLSSTERLEGAERAAVLLELDGQVEEAVAMYLAARQWHAAVRLILRDAPSLYRAGRGRRLLDWVDALPASASADHPWLTYWTGACQVWVDAPLANVTLGRAFCQFAVVGDVAGEILAAGAASRACLLEADWHVLDRWIAELDRLLSADTVAVAPPVLLTGFSRLLYITLARQARHPRLPQWADRTSELLDAEIDPGEVLLAGFSLLFYFTWTGQTAQGDQLIRRLEPLTSDERVSPAALVYWLFAKANFTLRVDDPGNALEVIDRALDLAESNGLSISGVIRRHRIAHLLTVGQLAEADEELVRLSTVKRVEPFYELRAWLALLRGDVQRASEEAAVALRTATERGRTFYVMFDHALLAQIGATDGRLDQAIGHLDDYREATTGMPGECAAFQTSLVEAHIALRQDDRAACHASLRRGLEIGSRQRYRSCWGWDPAMIVPLVSEALEHGICAPYARDLIRTHRFAPATPDIEHWPWPVRIRTLGRFEVQIDGRPLRFEGKAQRKPLELLKVMIASGDCAIAIERVVDLLWEQPEDGGRKAFDVTVHRLRKLLGLEAAVEVADRQASLNARFVWVDVWALDRILLPLDSANGQTVSPTRLEDVAPRVLGLFNGAFLPGDADSSWHFATRNRLTGRFQRFAQNLGGYRERERQWDRACALYQRVVELDPLAESFYYRQMICLREQGRRAEAIEVFRRCRHILSITLGIVPTTKTEDLYRELSSG